MRPDCPSFRPSPNLRSIEALIHYPGLCLFEGTNLSVGRGTDHPFEQIGAPWLDTTGVLGALSAARLPGVAFTAVRFTPSLPGDGKYADTLVAGIRLRVTDRSRYDPTLTAVTLLEVVGGRLTFTPRQFDRLAGDDGALRRAVMARSPIDWAAPRAEFLARRQAFLLYPE